MYFLKFALCKFWTRVMDATFIYDRYVTGRNFISRKTECNTLANLLSKGENVVIYEPPKSGKMSMIRQTVLQMRLAGTDFVIYGLNLFNIRTVPDFLVRFGSAVIRASASSPEEYAGMAGEYLAGTHFRFDQGRFADFDEVLTLDGTPDMDDISAILRLPCRIVSSKGEKVIVIFEEFQNLMMADGYEDVFKVLEAVMRDGYENRRCPFILSGSCVNAMKYIFEEQRFFYRLVEHLPLYPADDREIVEYMVKGFLLTGKAFEKVDAMQVCAFFDRNLWYINHFSAICDAMTKGYVNTSVMMEALNILISIHEPKFRAIMDSLTGYQLNLLRAVLDGVTRFSATDIIDRYGLNSSANVKRVKDALKKKEVITFNEKDEPVFLDPLFRYWVEKYYFERQ